MTISRDLGRRAKEDVQYLAGEIGPRPAGSTQLRCAQEYLRERLNGWGYAVEEWPFQFSKRSWMKALYPAAGGVLIGAGFVFNKVPALTLGLPLVGAGIPQLSRWLIRRSRLNDESQNLIARSEEAKKTQTLLFCAHLDTAQALPYRRPEMARLHARRLTFYQRAAVAVGLFSLFSLLGFPLVPWGKVLVSGVCLLAGGWMILSEVLAVGLRAPSHSPGAIDNASGAAVLLVLAEYFSRHPLDDLGVSFLFTDAEETGLDGARAAAARLDPERVMVINVDQVGAGSRLGLIAREGTFRVRKTDQALNEVLRAVHPDITALSHTRRSGDYRPFLLGGFRVTSLEMIGSARSKAVYHTCCDTPELVESGALGLTAQVLIRAAEKLDQSAAER